MKKFFAEFKKFITRGNVLDMAVGVIVGGAFTAIVNGLSNFILKPFINFLLAVCFGENSLDKVYTFLKTTYVLDDAGVATTTIDLAKSIYIDWGSFITAIIDFLLIALVLFCIVKTINKFKEGSAKIKSVAKGKLTKEQKKELKEAGVCRKDKAAVEAYFAQKAKAEEEAALALKAEEEAKALADRLANPTTEDLLKKIIVLLEEKK